MKRTGILLFLLLFVATVFAPVASFAGTTGRRNTAIALTAGTVYTLAKGKTLPGLVLGAGSFYAWKQYNKSRQDETYRQGYSDGRHRRHYRR